jgi:uncharacterized protein YegP (UPF0339 family)
VQHKLEVFRREDGLWAWRLYAANGRLLAVDGGNGFDNKADAAMTARELLAGDLELVADAAAPELADLR